MEVGVEVGVGEREVVSECASSVDCVRFTWRAVHRSSSCSLVGVGVGVVSHSACTTYATHLAIVEQPDHSLDRLFAEGKEV